MAISSIVLGLGTRSGCSRVSAKSPSLAKVINWEAVGVKLFPDFVEGLKVILAKWISAFLRGHAEVLQNDGDVHVNHDKERDNDVHDEEEDAHWRVSAVTFHRGAWILLIRVTIRWVVENGSKKAIPPRWGGYHEQADHAIPKGFKIIQVIYANLPLYVGKVWHAKDRKDEHDQEQQKADIEQGRQWHHQGKQ